MYGLDAISCANGWAMAAVGASIVITGLSILSFLISQLHRLVSLFEKEKINISDRKHERNKENLNANIPEKISGGLEETLNLYISLTKSLGDSFQLSDLYKLSNNLDLPHPYISIRDFRNSGLLISLGEERFSWKLTSV